MTGEPWLLDTNILIRWVKPNDSDFALVDAVTRQLQQSNAELCYTSQNLGEFWNVLTRPANRNGYGFSPLQADRKAVGLEVQLRLLPESPLVHVEWRKLLLKHSISGAQVHDARLAASMLVHGVRKILSFNTRDFARFSGIEAIHPSQIAKP
ncbi:MAG TPA: PIN domain-containing protein [Terracidiphilus sp.]|jgi:predicted nucleic acid-binding protein|nr:PIN domain-containing protein [Terracidiphilus sp.]